MKDNWNRTINYLRLSVTDRCNLRCRYCMPEDGIEKRSHHEMLSEEEMVAVVKAAAELGVTKVRLTGGEPLVKKNILSLAEKTASTEGIDTVAITTNGILLPSLAEPLFQAGVRNLNISLDTLQEEKYHRITRWGELDDALQGLEKAFEVGFDHIKINTVLVGGFNDDEIPALAALTEKYPLDVRFIELMPMTEDSFFSSSSFVSNRIVLDKLPELQMEEEDGVAKMYRLPGANGRIGLISPVTSHFCSTCNRIRVTADGKVKPCLHAKEEYSLKGLPYEEMKNLLKQAILGKPEKHGPLSFLERSQSGRHMNEIGG